MQHTNRATISQLEEIIDKQIPVLDHGFIRLIDYMGDDSAIVQAARVSYGKGTKQLNQDKALINYLMRHRHTTPFEMCDIKFHVKLPIFIARQWIRHRTGSFNEYSARYSILGNEFYTPNIENLTAQSKSNKQGRSNETLPKHSAERALSFLTQDAERCYANYLTMLNEDTEGNILDQNNVGISRELARMNLNLSYYTEWYWKTNLHNLLHFIALRVDSHAQYEIREYAKVLLDIVKKWVPLTFSAFEEYIMNGELISGKSINIIKKMLNKEHVTRESCDMSQREWDELMRLFEIKSQI